MYNNGNITANITFKLPGSLAHGATYTIAYGQAVATIKNIANVTSGVAGFNGDDAVGLYKNDMLIDIIGEIGVQEKWSGFGANGTQGSTENKTLVRAAHIKSPNNTFTWNEWDVYPEDTFTYFGNHTMNATTPGLAKEVQANAWAEYFLDATSLYCEELSGDELAGSLWNEFGAEYAFMDATTKTLYKSTPSNPDSEGISGAKARYLYLITKYGTLNNFMKDENNNPIFSVNTRPEPSSANNQNLVVILTLSIATIFIGLYFYINKKKQLFTN